MNAPVGVVTGAAVVAPRRFADQHEAAPQLLQRGIDKHDLNKEAVRRLAHGEHPPDHLIVVAQANACLRIPSGHWALKGREVGWIPTFLAPFGDLRLLRGREVGPGEGFIRRAKLVAGNPLCTADRATVPEDAARQHRLSPTGFGQEGVPGVGMFVGAIECLHLYHGMVSHRCFDGCQQRRANAGAAIVGQDIEIKEVGALFQHNDRRTGWLSPKGCTPHVEVGIGDLFKQLRPQPRLDQEQIGTQCCLVEPFNGEHR